MDEQKKEVMQKRVNDLKGTAEGETPPEDTASPQGNMQAVNDFITMDADNPDPNIIRKAQEFLKMILEKYKASQGGGGTPPPPATAGV